MSTETWLLNYSFDFENKQWITLSASFTSSGQSFSSIKYSYADFNCHYINYDDTEVYNDDDYIGWTDEAYRTIVLDTPATGNLLTWLQANAVKQVTPRISVDLKTQFPDQWAGLTIGKHTVQIRAKNPGNYLDSDLSTAIDFYKTVPITVTATNCTAASSNPTEFPDVGGGDTILTFNKKTGYTLPETIVITGVAGQNIGYSWTVASDGQSAQLKILKALGDIAVTVTGVAETYNITVNGTNARQASGPSTITYGGSATLTFAYDDGYFAPTSIKDVAGATGSWNQSTSTLNLTNCTGPVTVTIEGAVKTFNITYSLTNVNSASGNPTTIASNASAVKITLVKPTGYNLPNKVAITGVDAKNWSYDGTTGIITISRPTANVTIAAVGQPIVYTIATTTENATADPSNPTTIAYGTTVTLKFTFPADYTAPDDADVAVTGATKQWTKSTGTLVLSNPTANVTVQVAGVWELQELTGTYTWKETIPEATWTEQLVNFALADGTAYKKMYWTDNGTTYYLYYDDMLEEGSETKVYSYDGDEQTGTWVDPKYRIVNFTSEDVQYVPANFYNYVIANTTQATQLATPQNVTADGTTVSWDVVKNATSYAVLADGSEIGRVEQAAPETAVGTWLLNTTLTRPTTTQRYNVNFKYPGNTVTTTNGQMAVQSGK